MIFEKTHPSVSVGWEKQTLPGGCAVVVIKVAKSLHPVFPGEYATELTFREPVDFSTRIVTSRTCADLSDVERERLREHIRAGGDKTLLDLSDEDFDKAMGFVRPDPIDNVLMPTFGGLLMIGKPEALQRGQSRAGARHEAGGLGRKLRARHGRHLV